MNDVFRWEDPPAQKRNGLRGKKYESAVAALKSRPGVWALVFADVGTSSAIGLRQRGCKVVCRKGRKVKGKFVCDIYAIWPADATLVELAKSS